MNRIKVKLEFLAPILGSLSNNKELLADYIVSKSPIPEQKEEEMAAVATFEPESAKESIEKQTTVFPRTPEGYCHVYDYQVRGFMKEAIGVGVELGAPEMGRLSKWRVKQAVDGMLFVEERRILFKDPDGNPIKNVNLNERPMRVETMQGPRVCLARSEEIPVGTSIEFTLKWLENTNVKSTQKITLDIIIWALEYGCLKGIGQWRSGGKGAFSYTYEVLHLDNPPRAKKAKKAAGEPDTEQAAA